MQNNNIDSSISKDSPSTDGGKPERKETSIEIHNEEVREIMKEILQKKEIQ